MYRSALPVSQENCPSLQSSCLCPSQRSEEASQFNLQFNRCLPITHTHTVSIMKYLHTIIFDSHGVFLTCWKGDLISFHTVCRLQVTAVPQGCYKHQCKVTNTLLSCVCIEYINACKLIACRFSNDVPIETTSSVHVL